MTKSRQSADFAAGGFFAGKNKIINGDFGVWQRGTSFNIATGTEVFGPDRFKATSIHSSGTASISRQTFTPGTAPVAGYEGSYFCRLTAGTAGSPLYLDFFQKVEDVRTFAGQTVTLSFWAKSSANITLTPLISQDFGGGGSARVDAFFPTASITTSWARYSVSVAVPSISGKTIGTNSHLFVYLLGGNVSASQTIDFWGIQVETGSVATPFQTATGTIQGELAACQRYYWRTNATNAYSPHGQGGFVSSTAVNIYLVHPVPMRISPTSLDFSNISVFTLADVQFTVSAATLLGAVSSGLISRVQAGVTGGTAGTGAILVNNNTTAGYVGLSAEL